MRGDTRYRPAYRFTTHCTQCATTFATSIPTVQSTSPTPKCKNAHIAVTKYILMKPKYRAREPCLMTTRHKEKSLEEALWYFLEYPTIDDHYLDTGRAAIAISIGGDPSALKRSSTRSPIRGNSVMTKSPTMTTKSRSSHAQHYSGVSCPNFAQQSEGAAEGQNDGLTALLASCILLKTH